MKNAMLLLGIWVGIILTAYGLVYWGGDVGTSADALMSASLYVDANGAFEVPVPVGWWVDETESGAVLHGPLQEITVWAASSRELGAFQVLGLAWESIAPCRSPFFRITDSLSDGVSGWKVRIAVECDSPDVPRLAVIHMTSGATATLLIQYEDEYPEDRRADYLKTIVEGFANLL